jgi:hypothetical protein
LGIYRKWLGKKIHLSPNDLPFQNVLLSKEAGVSRSLTTVVFSGSFYFFYSASLTPAPELTGFGLLLLSYGLILTYWYYGTICTL